MSERTRSGGDAGRPAEIASLVDAMQRVADPSARAVAEELVQSVLELHRAGLERTIELIREGNALGSALVDELASDDLVGSLLLLHGLHPVDLETRVRRAVGQLQTSLRRHGGDVELLDIRDGTVRLRVTDAGRGCGAPAAVAQSVEDALYEAAPDLTALVIERPPDQIADGFIPLSALRTRERVAQPYAKTVV